LFLRSITINRHPLPLMAYGKLSQPPDARRSGNPGHIRTADQAFHIVFLLVLGIQNTEATESNTMLFHRMPSILPMPDCSVSDLFLT